MTAPNNDQTQLGNMNPLAKIPQTVAAAAKAKTTGAQEGRGA